MFTSSSLALAISNKDIKQIENHLENKVILQSKDYKTAFLTTTFPSFEIINLLVKHNSLSDSIETIFFTLLWTNKIKIEGTVQLNKELINFSGCADILSPMRYSVQCEDIKGIKDLVSSGAKQRPLFDTISSIRFLHFPSVYNGMNLKNFREEMDTYNEREETKAYLQKSIKNMEIASLFLKDPTNDLDVEIRKLSELSKDFYVKEKVRNFFIWAVIKKSMD
ncbi:MAG: hypothetical protein JO131_10420 [Gammaproteobacteria bacterium]|nr:hypothetical protein [Gammaproteobacteria bacterium]